MHRQISAYYSGVHEFTEGMILRDWLAGKSYEIQYQWGVKILAMFGVTV